MPEQEIKANKNRISSLEEQLISLQVLVSDLTRAIEGDPALNVRSLRSEMQEIRVDIGALKQVWARAQWVAATLGASNVGSIIAFLATILRGGGIP